MVTMDITRFVTDHLRAALDYAEGGIHVFPLASGTKVPATSHGVHDATTDSSRIEGWWADSDLGIGISCDPSGLFVVDVDARAGFDSSESARLALALPETFTVATPGGGWHFYFTGHGPSSVGKLLPGVDTRGVGGYVVAPPTAGYTVLWDEALADVPPATLEALQRRPSRVEAQGDALDRTAVLQGVPEGRRQDTLFRYICSLLARGVDQPEAEILAAHVAEACDPPFSAHEAAAIVDRVFHTYPAPDFAEATPEVPLLARLSDFSPEPVEWFWYPRIPYGKLTLLAGVQGHGKSYVTAALTAAATRGQMLPDSLNVASPPGDVIIAAYEDGIGDTVRIRMERQGVDLDRVHVLATGMDGRRRRAFRQADLPALEDALDAMPERRLLIIDPISSFLGGGIDGNSNEAVRAALEPLAALATQFGVAVIAVAHLNKSQIDNALYRVSGANAFTALPRSVLLVSHEEEKGRRSIVHIKSNLDAKADPIGFQIGRDGLTWRR